MSPKQGFEEASFPERNSSFESNETAHIGEVMDQTTPDSLTDISDAPSCASGDGIDHTAALLGVMADDSDDELERCCFSPSASQDVLDSAMNEEIRGADNDVDNTGTRSESLAADSRKKSEVKTIFLENGKEMTNLPVSKRPGSNPISMNKFNDECPFFFFDPRLVSSPLEDDYSHQKSSKVDRSKNQTTLKALAIKEKASSALQAKAKKTLDLITLPHHKVQKMKARKSNFSSRDNNEDKSQISAVSSVSATRSLYTNMKTSFVGASIPVASVRFCADSTDDCTVRSQLSETSSQAAVQLVRNGMRLPTIPKLSGTKAARRLRDEMNASHMKNYLDSLTFKKSNLSVIGDTKSIIRHNRQPSEGVDDYPNVLSPTSSIDSDCPGSNAPNIMKTFSSASSNNSHVSCIDEDGFLITPTASVDNTEASTHVSEDGLQYSGSGSRTRSTAQSRKPRALLPPRIGKENNISYKRQGHITMAEF
mmetsp:Transcript_29962/g.64181  ORF Transcript_29962/g.64181 Transcript_29962/m.64181 type:complete len:480 (-) Transcript_29962:152-1591(-)